MDINANQKNLDLAYEMIDKANMSARPAAYSGNGAHLEDFEYGKYSLNVVFNELRKINKKYALDFITFIMTFQELNATNFLTSFYSFAKNGFSLENVQIAGKGYSLETNGDEERDAIAHVTVISSLGGSSERDDTLAIKERFFNRLPKDITEMPKIKVYARNGYKVPLENKTSTDRY